MSLHELIIVDCNSIFTPAYEVMGTKKALPHCIRLITNQYPEAYKTVLVWDLPVGSLRRKKIYPLYKANREEKPERYLFLNKLQKFFYFLGYVLAKPISKNYEADDIIALFARQASNDYDITIISKDLDMLSLVGDGVCVLDEKGGSQEGREPCHAKHMQLYKSLVGDASDNIKGLKGFGVKTFIKMKSIYSSEGLTEISQLIRDNDKNKMQEYANEFSDCKIINSINNDWNNIRACYMVSGFKEEMEVDTKITMGVPLRLSDTDNLLVFNKIGITTEEIKDFLLEDKTAEPKELPQLKKLYGRLSS